MSKTRDVGTVTLGELKVDEQIQRRLNWARAKGMANAFNPDGLGFLTVSQRDDGTRWIVDGQHRIAAARISGQPEGFEIPAVIFTGLSRAEEANLFLLLNETQPPRAFDKFRTAVVAGQPDAVEMFELLTSYGFTLRFGSRAPGTFVAVSALEWVYNGCAGITEGPDAKTTAKTLSVLADAYKRDPQGVQANLVRGIGALIAKHGDRIDLERLARIIFEIGPAGRLLGKAKSVYITGTRNVTANGVAIVVTDQYNRYLKTENRLPEWKSV